MNIQEMHIAIDLELNKLNSNLYDVILPQEKDYFLNRAQERKIKQYYDPQSNPKGKGFEMSQKRIDDLRNLLIPNYYDKAFLVNPTDFDYDTKQRFYFPDDYMFLTSHRSKVYTNDCTNITKDGRNDFTFTYCTLEIPYVDMLTFYIKYTGVTVLQVVSSAAEDRQLLIQQILNAWDSSVVAASGWNIYYEKYKNIYNPGKLIFVSTNVLSVITSGYEEAVIPVSANVDETLHYYTGTNGSDIVVPNRFAQQDDVYTMQIDPFNKTEPWSPLIIIHTNCIDVFIDNSFFVKEIAISYLRRPKLMSLSLNMSCELADEIHVEIVRDAVNLLLEDFEAKGRLETSLGVERTNE